MTITDSRTPAEFDLSSGWDPLDPAVPLAPAYRAAAALLADGDWHRESHLIAKMAEAMVDVDEADLRRFLHRVARLGWLTQKNIKSDDRPWRVTASGLMLRPELRGRSGQPDHPVPWLLALHATVAWLAQPRVVFKQANTPTAKASKPEPGPPRFAQLIAEPGDLHPTETCRCGAYLTYYAGVNATTQVRWAKWQCANYKFRGPGSVDPNHDVKWVS